MKIKEETPYVCIRCNYTTYKKSSIKNHFSRKNICPTSLNNIELTEEIKNEILRSRIYHIPKGKKDSKAENNIINQTINNNTINNIIISMDVIDKITELSKHNNCKLKSIEATIYNTYYDKIKLLDNGDKDIKLKDKDFYDILNNITTFKTVQDLRNLNIVYDANSNKLKLYEGSNIWIDEMIEFGILKLVDLIHENYLHRYEMYLLKKIYSDEIYNLREKAEYREALENYYRFIGIFDVKPYCLEKTNAEILDNNDSSYSIEEKSQSMYDKIAVPKSEIRETKKLLIDLLKTNGKNSIKELNKIILETIKVDEEFKSKILKDCAT